MWRVWFVVVVIFFGEHIKAQSDAVQERLASSFTTFTLSEIERSDLFRMSNQRSNDVNMAIPSPYRKSESIQLELFKTRVFADDYVRTAYHGDSVVTSDGLDLFMMDGRIQDRPETRVFVVTGNNYFFAYVDDGHETYYYEPISFYGGDIESNTVVIYNEEDVKSTNSRCGSNVYHQQKNSDRMVSTGRAGQCYEVDYAVVSDYRMYQDLGSSVAQVEAFTASITGLMNGDYDTSFDDELIHIIVQNVVSTSSDGDEWLQNGSPASIDQLLDEFSAWGPSNLVSHDVASLWTGYNLSGNTIGLAWLGVVCQSFRYNVLEHYTSNTNQLRVLTSHELGHNYDASHDSGSGFIMSSSVSNTSTWSPQSINAINAYYGSRASSCFEQCGGTGPDPDPLKADFTYNINETCVPGSVEFFDASSGRIGSRSWTFEGGDPSSSTCSNPVVTYAQAGSYPVTLTIINSMGTVEVSKSDVIVINDDPIASFTTQIQGNQVTFSNLSENANDYLWDFGNGETSAMESPQLIYDEPGSYLVSLTAYNECGSSEFTSRILVEIPPSAGIVADKVELCTGQSVQFSDVSSGNVTSRLWTFEGGSPANSVDESVSTQYFSPGLYDVSLHVSNNAGSDVIHLRDYIGVTNAVEADFTYVVDGNQVRLINISEYANAYSWSFGDGNGSVDENPTHSYQEGGTYQIELLARNHCSEDRKVLVVKIEVLPLAGFDVEGDNVICTGGFIQYLSMSSSNVDTYFWEFEGGSPATSNDPEPLIQYNSSGIYNVSLTVTNAAGSDTETIDNYVTVTPEAVATFTYDVNERLIQFYNQSNNASTYFWDFGDGKSTSENEPQHEYEADGTYEVTLKAQSICGEDSYTEAIEVQSSPVAGFQLVQSDACTGDTLKVKNLSVGEVMNYEWTCEGAEISDPVAPEPLFIFNESGTYDISLTVTNKSGSDIYTLEKAVTILDGVGSEVEYSLDGLSVFFTNNSTAGTHEWDFGDGNRSEEIEPVYVYDQEGVFEVIHTVTNVCGTDKSLIELNLYSKPVASFEIINGKVCTSQAVQVENKSSSNAETFTWISEGATISGDELNPVFKYDLPGNYSITLIVSNPGGEDTLNLINAVEIIDIPEPQFNFNTELLVVDFEAVETYDTEYHWDFGDGNVMMGPRVKHNYSEPGIYQVNLMVTNECGSNSLSREVVVNELPSAGFTVDTDSLCLGNIVQYTNQSSENSMGYQWVFEGGIPESSVDPNPSVMYPDPGLYDVRLIVMGVEGNDTLDRIDFIDVKGTPELIYDVVVEGNIITVDHKSENHEYSAFILGNDTIPGTRIEYAASFNGVFTIVLMAQNECGISSDSIITDIDVFPEASLNLETITVCAGTDLIFPEIVPRDGDLYTWNVIGKDSIYMSEVVNPVFNFVTEGIYDVQLIIRNQYGVDSVQLDELIYVESIAPAKVQYDLDGNRVIASDVNTGDYSRLWDMGDGTQLEGVNIVHDYKEDGIYLMVYTTENQCGQDLFFIELEVISSSVSEPAFQSVKIYPNPTSDHVIIDAGNVAGDLNIQLMGPNGTFLKRFDIKAETQFNRLDLTDIPSGSYLLSISDGRRTDYMKVVVAK